MTLKKGLGIALAAGILYATVNGLGNVGSRITTQVRTFVEERIEDHRLARFNPRSYSPIEWNLPRTRTEPAFLQNLESRIDPTTILSAHTIHEPSQTYPLEPAYHPPNPRGGIPLISFHNINPDDSGSLAITPEEFRSRLERFYTEGFVSVSLDELITDRLDEVVAEGRRAVVLTFDDAWSGQFRLLEHERGLVVDPMSALGIYQDFVHHHPDFRYNATFFIDFDNPPFADTSRWSAMLAYLANEGLEVAAHSISGANMKNLGEQDAQYEIGRSSQIIEKITGKPVRYFAFPYGGIPRDVPLDRLMRFATDEYDVSLDAGVKIFGTVQYPPSSERFDLDDLLHRWEGSSPSHEFYRLFEPRTLGGPGSFFASSGTPSSQPPLPLERPLPEESKRASAPIVREPLDPDVILIDIIDPAQYLFATHVADVPLPEEINSYQLSLLQRFAPIRGLIERAATQYDLDPVWIAQLYLFESELNPLAANERTSDYGIAQMKQNNFDHGISLLQGKNVFRSDLADTSVPNIFNPDQSILASTARMRYNIEFYDIQNANQLAALYRAGPSALLPDGGYRENEQPYISAHARRRYLAQSLARISIEDDLESRIATPHVADIISASDPSLSVQENYARQIDHSVRTLLETPLLDWFSAELYVNAVLFTRTLDAAYGADVSQTYQTLEEIGMRYATTPMHGGVRTRYVYAMDLLTTR